MSATMLRWWGVVPAAGCGARMEADIPKQYLSIGGETLLSRSVKRLLKLSRLEQIVVAVDRDDERWYQLPVMSDLRVKVVIGGAERAESVLVGLLALTNAHDDDWVMVHDAARPCVRSSAMRKMLDTLANDPVGGIMALPVADTLKQSNSVQKISKTIDRRGLWAAQTPQLFRLGLLRKALQQAQAKGTSVTDEASAMEQAGHVPRLYLGSSHNIKITHTEDLELAALILEAQGNG
ncbi:MAG: 2-C-methyl-D-erythritol 4-phosphate cytidylyltransferase [Bermanella sp.]|jgi:2-C-methyl-D-erythritol 4-phosphate cytidylyltransferase